MDSIYVLVSTYCLRLQQERQVIRSTNLSDLSYLPLRLSMFTDVLMYTI